MMAERWRADARLTQDLLAATEAIEALLAYLPGNVLASEAKDEFHMGWHRLVAELRKVAKESGALYDDGSS